MLGKDTNVSLCNMKKNQAREVTLPQRGKINFNNGQSHNVQMVIPVEKLMNKQKFYAEKRHECGFMKRNRTVDSSDVVR